VEISGEVALDAAHDLSSRQALPGAAFDVGKATRDEDVPNKRFDRA
jgi:hypothetical protein